MIRILQDTETSMYKAQKRFMFFFWEDMVFYKQIGNSGYNERRKYFHDLNELEGFINQPQEKLIQGNRLIKYIDNNSDIPSPV